MRLLVLRHVDGDQVALAAVEQVGQRQRRSRSCRRRSGRRAGTRRSAAAGRRARPATVRMRWAIASSAWSWPMTRSLEPLLERRGRSGSRRPPSCPTGMPVQPEMTSAIGLRRRRRACTSGLLALERAQLGPLGVELGSRELRRRLRGSAALRPSPSCARRRSRSPPRSRSRRSRDLASTSSCSFSQRSSSSAELGLRGRLALRVAAPPAARAWSRAGRPPRARGSRISRVEVVDARGAGPRSRPGVAPWPIATRAQAVSSTLTDLSGSCRAGM